MTASALRRLAALVLAVASAPAALADCKLLELAKLPVTMVGRGPLVPAKVNGTKLMFLLDSGAFDSMMPTSTATLLNLPLSPVSRYLRFQGLGGEVEVSHTYVRELTLDGVPVRGFEFLVSGFDPGRGAAGLLGQNLLLNFDIDYDLANGVIRLMKPDDGCRDSALAYWAGSRPYSSIELEKTDSNWRHTRALVFVNDHPVDAIFDTGAPASVLGLGAARRAGVKPGMPGVEFTGYAGGVGSYRRDEWIGRFDEFRIADEKITHTRLRISDLSRLHADMLIGVDFFLSHRVYVSKLQHRMYFTYNGGPVFDLRHGSEPSTASEIESDDGSAAEPADAEAFGRRSRVRAARGDTRGALADASRASELAPEDPQYLYLRAVAGLAAGQRAQALEDLDSVIKQEPAYVPALISRASMRVADGQPDLAVTDLDAAEHMVMGPADVRLQFAALYQGAGRPDSALIQLDRWIAAHADDSKMSYALGLRCRIRALQGSDLDKARSDCREALNLAEDVPEFLDSRALVTLRSGDFDRAIRQYDAALEKKPDLAWSLYGRGLAKLKIGQVARGQADIDAAKAADPKIAEEAARYGIAP